MTLPERYIEQVLDQLDSSDRHQVEIGEAPDLGPIECCTIDLSQEALKRKGGRDFIWRSIRDIWANAERSDYASLVGAARQYAHLADGVLDERKLRRWCEMVGLHEARMRRIVHHANLVRGSVSALRSEDIWADRSYDSDNLTRALLAGEFLGCGRLRRGSAYTTANGSAELSYDSLCTNEGVVLLGGVGNVNVGADSVSMIQRARYAAPLDPSWILDSVPGHIITTRPIGGRFYDDKSDEVRERVAVLIRGVEIGECIRRCPLDLASSTIFWSWALSNPSSVPEDVRRVLERNALVVDAAEKLSKKLGSTALPFGPGQLSIDSDLREHYLQWLVERSTICSAVRDVPPAAILELDAAAFTYHFMRDAARMWGSKVRLEQ